MWLAADLELGDGQRLRFGGDEADPADILADVSFSTSNPGGFSDGAFTIHRGEWATREALLFSPVRIYGPGDRTFYEGRVRDISQVDRDSIRLDLEGWAAHLDDDESFTQLYVSRDLSKWGAASRARKVATLAVFSAFDDASVEPDTATGIPSLTATVQTGAGLGICEGWFDAGPGQLIASVYYDYTSRSVAGDTGAIILSDDDIATTTQTTGDLLTGTNSSGTGTLTATTPYRYVLIQAYGTTTTSTKDLRARRLAVFGNHGLTKTGTAPDDGYLGSDILEHAISTAAPMLTVGDSVEQSTYIFTDFWHESGTVRELVERVTSFGGGIGELNDWGVYDDRTFFWRSPGTHGRVWRVRRDQVAVPTEDGPSADGRFSGVLVSYTDAAGTTKTVGPVGSGADTEDDRLTDTNENNPATRVPNRIVRRDVGLTVEEGAILLGQALLAEQNASIRRGNVTLTGTAIDDGGIEHPVAAVRACDRVVVEDEPGVEPETQYVNSTSYDNNSETVTANLGFAPHKVDIVLARLAAAVQGL